MSRMREINLRGCFIAAEILEILITALSFVKGASISVKFNNARERRLHLFHHNLCIIYHLDPTKFKFQTGVVGANPNLGSPTKKYK